jgi:hypothetical protein
LEEIVAGQIDLAFRLWRKPTVRPGGRLRTAVGELAIGRVDVVEASDIDDADAVRAGYPSAAALLDDLFRERKPGARARTAKPDETSRLYRVEVSYAGPDPRVALREHLLDPEQLDAMVERLASMDRRAARGPWTAETLELIDAWPARRAPELAALAGQETLPWKADVRRLKELGLTESLTVGYRLSPRGDQVLGELRRRATGVSRRRGKARARPPAPAG